MSKHLEWFGTSGLDTEYERSLIKYRPNLIYPERESRIPLEHEIVQNISRSQDFMVSKAIFDYESLILDIDKLLKIIEKRQKNESFNVYLEKIKQKDLQEVFQIEEKQSSYSQTGDFEIYTMLYYMKSSIQERNYFMDEYLRSQFSSESEIGKIMEDERKSISEWIKLEYDLSEEHEKAYEAEDFFENEEQIKEIEKEKRELELLHTSLADISYVHRNRFVIFKSIVEEAETIIVYPETLIDGNMKILIEELSRLRDFSELKAHLVLSFKKIKTQHDNLKSQYMFIDDEKETFASERHYLYQQITTVSNENVKEWLYSQPDVEGKTLNLFSSYIVDSVIETSSTYEESVSDLLSIYRSQASFYGEQIKLLQKKKELRLFWRLIEDLGDTATITDEWIENYLKEHKYEA